MKGHTSRDYRDGFIQDSDDIFASSEVTPFSGSMQ